MIGKTLHHKLSGITGPVDRITGHPDGKCLVRINDHWLFANDCVNAVRVTWTQIALVVGLMAALSASLALTLV
jgi:hypothetical protein